MTKINRFAFKPCLILFIVFSFPITVCAQDNSAFENTAAEPSDFNSTVEEDESRSIATRILMYLPNRVLDLLDIVRVRARVGPGIGIGARITEAISIDASSYATIYVGLPGPRQEPILKSPIAPELYSGLGISFLKIETNDYGPKYSPTEIGIDLQVLLAGASVTVDPLEILDFITGFVGIEVVEDDL